MFEPTEEEFRDPMGYVRKIEEEGRRYGMVKIIPPRGWKMPFVTDTEVRFHLSLLFLISSSSPYTFATGISLSLSRTH